MRATRWGTAVLTGAVAGAVGTLAMDLVWFKRARASGSDDHFGEWELSGDTTSFDEAGAPAQLAEKAASAVGVDLPDSSAGTTTDVVHWTTGTGWAVGASLLSAATGLHPLGAGLAAGAAAFGGAYTILPVVGLYDPIWAYDGKTLWKDATAHATFGAATGVALGLLTGAARRS